MTFSEEEICKNIVSDIETNIEETKQNIDYRKKLILEQKKYIRDSHGDMDDEEFLQNMESVNKDVQFIGHEIKKLNTMERQVDSPYFGKVSFRYAEGDELLVYVGMKGYEPENIPDIRVYDWRAPVSSLYYDYEKGAAEYMTPDGEVTGEITEKKQFDIYKGRLRQAVDTDENINDDLLLHALSDNSHSKMKEVVATIQKEQNKIIRNNSAYNLLVDGRAGSGKTVIAMHRLAWLLFNHKKTIKADNVMILSPNGIFADYISEVLPEIGEDNVPEKEFDLLMEEILFAAEEYESRLEQSDWIVVNGGSKDFEIQKRIDNIKIKSSIAFFDALNEYLDSYVAGIQFKTFRFQGVVYEKEQIERMFL
jgi:DNA helicase-2/ATP-dependent DNA helicase PcrA